MSCEGEAVTILRESGQKLTPQRLMVVTVLRHADGHLSANQILDQVQRNYPYVDISTVYRTVSMLKELHLVTETNLRGGELTYEWASGARHHHLICRECGAMQQLDDGALHELAQQFFDLYGFQADIDHFAILGLCKGCRAKETSHAAH
jgi:Fur family ferric uptake transcriptional regulator